MPPPRAMATLATGLFAVAALTLGALWSRSAMRHPSADARPGATQPACAPLNPDGPAPAACPQAR